MKTFKILSIDGGGIKGLYSAKILNHFEKQLQKENNDDSLRIVDYFDLICGTSTGGLIALALSLKIPTSTICEFYEKYGAKIFPQTNSLIAFIKQILLSGKYSDENLKIALNDFFNDRKIGESNCLLCIPTYDITNGTYEIFKYDHKEGNLSRHNNLAYVDVALATSAAPTFLPLAQIGGTENNKQFVDGGVWANNPSLVGLTEAIRHFVGDHKEYKKIQLLSVASISIISGHQPMIKRSRSFRDWGSKLFDLPLDGQSEFCDFFLQTLYEHMKFAIEYERIPSPAVKPSHIEHIGLDIATEKSFELMKSYADDIAYPKWNTPEIRSFFKDKKTYLMRK